MPDFSLEAACPGIVCGIDESGRGPWAGPVVAAAVVLDRRRVDPALVKALDDSKRVPPPRRRELFAALEAEALAGAAVIATAAASVEEIDRLNILQATFLAMGRAMATLAPPPMHALVDGDRLPVLPCSATAVIRGDRLSASIAAASIVAKVVRDRIMTKLDRIHPGYGFGHHFGYGTEVHQQALLRLGVTPHHRKSFAPIHQMLYPE